MLQPPPGLDRAELLRVLADEYGARGVRLDFAPEGEDSWAFRAGELWVSVRRDLRGHVPEAYEAAAGLRASGLDFVLAPMIGRDGQVVRRVGVYPVVVFPFTELRALSQPPTTAEIDRVHGLIERLHGAPAAAGLPREDFTVSFAADIVRAIRVPQEAPVDCGPYGVPLHRLLARHHSYVTALNDELESLAVICRASASAPVLTHGEPIATNVFRSGTRLLIGDWGDLMWGPPERDWSHVIRTIGGRPICRPEFLRFYDIRWILSEVAEYVTAFLEPHTDDADARAMWGRLGRYLPPVG